MRLNNFIHKQDVLENVGGLIIPDVPSGRCRSQSFDNGFINDPYLFGEVLGIYVTQMVIIGLGDTISIWLVFRCNTFNSGGELF
jgi:hypothetical protein